MTWQVVLFVILHVVSILFSYFALHRLYSYIRRFRFAENQYTLLFGFVHMHWIAYLYVSAVIGWIIVSYFLIF